MKTIFATLLFISAMASVSLSYAEDSAEPDDTTAQDSALYMNEIKKNCEAEASGMSEEDAKAYIKECIDAMKQSFSQ